MNILIFGAGVIGSTYGWLMQKSGHKLTHYVRENSYNILSEKGFTINCIDKRINKNITEQYFPEFTKTLNITDKYDLILISVNSHQLEPVLKQIKESSCNSDILILQNLRPDSEARIKKYFTPDKCIIGFPFISGGGRENNIIRSTILNSFINHTMLGTIDGKENILFNKVFALIKQINMKPQKTDDIFGYTFTHYIWAASTLGAFIKSGSYKNYISDGLSLKDSYRAMRETLEVCRYKNIDQKKFFPANSVYYPLFILEFYSRLSFRDKGMQNIIEGHIGHSAEEMKVIYYDVYNQCKEYGIKMKTYESFKDFVDKYK